MAAARTARLTPISGLREKAPACFLVETGAARLLLDFGEGPPPGRVPDVAAIGTVDAILLSHQHLDHMGALKLRARIGNPDVFASDIVARTLPDGVRAQPLPLGGHATVRGLAVTTGRSGHAPGGVWIHLGIGDGLLYMGDNSPASLLYADDPPPPAATVILDGSYGDADAPLASAIDAFAALARQGPLLLPVVPQGRGPEMALAFARRGLVPAIDKVIRDSIRALIGASAACVRDEARAELARLAELPPIPDAPAGIMIVTPATAAGGSAGAAIDTWSGDGRVQIVCSGYVPPGSPIAALVTSGRARVERWHIHPGLADNAALVRSTGARTVLPAFADAKYLDAWQRAFAPARVVLDGSVEV